MRLRRRNNTLTSTQVIGRFYHHNSRTGETTKGSPHQAVTGPSYREVTMDELHEGPPYTTGGPFFNVLVTGLDAVAGNIHVRGGQLASGSGLNAIYREIGRTAKPGDEWRRAYEGGLIVRPPVQFTVPSATIDGPDDWHDGVNPDNLNDLGARAYNRLRPKPEKVGLFQSLAEIREIPRMIRPLAADHARNWDRISRDFRGLDDLSMQWQRDSRRRLLDRMSPKRAADTFLGVQFGWKPFVKDVVDLVDTTINYDDYLQSAIRRNGRWKQRRFIEDELVSSTLVYSNSSSGLSVQSWSEPSFGPAFVTSSSIQVFRETLTQIWYEGSFRFYYPEFNKIPPAQLGQLVMLQRKLRLHGLYISPTLIYRVVPWTWLLDWFVNIGDNLQVLEDQLTARVASRYMYLMRHTYDRYRYVLTLNFTSGQTATVEKIGGVECQRRVQAASNFGFSIAPGGLSPMQLAILAALGISSV